MAGENPQTTMPPVPREPMIDQRGQMSPQWTRWIQQVQRVLSFSGGIAWQIVNKGGSALSDIESRTHAMLQSVMGWTKNADATQDKHISNANGKKWEDHVDVVNGNPHGTDHAMLDAVQVLDPTSADATQDKHLSNAQGKVWQDHVAITDANPHGTNHSQLDSILGTGDRHITATENAEITALDALAAGIVVKVGNATYTVRSVQGTANEIVLSFGDGQSGNPTVSLPLTIAGPRRFGGATDYTEFEADGTRRAAGAATAFRDIDFPVIVKTVGAGVPALATLQGNLQMLQWAVNDSQQIEVKEQVHLWKEASTGYWHCHIITGGSDATDRYLRFEIEWTWANFLSVIAPNIITTSPDMLIPANTPALTHLAFDIGQASFTDGRIAAHIKARAKRVAAVGVAPTANPFCEMFQMHVECDTDGSRQQWIK